MTEEEKARYFELLRFKSVGVDKTKLRYCVECATWLKKSFEDIGFSASLRLPDGVSCPPCLYAERIVDHAAGDHAAHEDESVPAPVEEPRVACNHRLVFAAPDDEKPHRIGKRIPKPAWTGRGGGEAKFRWRVRIRPDKRYARAP